MSEDKSTSEDWVILTSSRMEVGIQILKAKLESEGIRCVIYNKMDSVYRAFGEIELHVHRSDYLKAKFHMDAST